MTEPVRSLEHRGGGVSSRGRYRQGSYCRVRRPSQVACSTSTGHISIKCVTHRHGVREGVSPGVHMRDQVLIVQAADLKRSKRRIPDRAVWTRCFILYIRVLMMDRPERLTDLLGYMDAIIRASQKFSWPACVEYDVKFRQMAAGDEKRQWAALDASLYTECFTGQTLRWAVEAPRGRQEGQSREPTYGRKRMRMGADPPEADTERADLGSQVCAKYNKYKGDCRFGTRCKYTHSCSRCRGLHPVSECERRRQS